MEGEGLFLVENGGLIWKEGKGWFLVVNEGRFWWRKKDCFWWRKRRMILVENDG